MWNSNFKATKSVLDAASNILKGEQLEEKKLDPVGQADADIDNDGDVDKSDEYLHNRRKAIKKAMKKEEADLDEATDDFGKNFGKRIGMLVKGGKSAEYLKKKADQARQQNKDLDPGAAKKGLGIGVIDKDKANKKRMAREEVEIDEAIYDNKHLQRLAITRLDTIKHNTAMRRKSAGLDHNKNDILDHEIIQGYAIRKKDVSKLKPMKVREEVEIDEASTVNGVTKKPGEKTWKSTSMSHADAIKMHGKDNVRIGPRKTGLGKDDVQVHVEAKHQDTVSIDEGMPSSVIKSKQRNAEMSHQDFAARHKDKSDDELRSMAWRHGYGKGSNYYVNKRNKGLQSEAKDLDDKNVDKALKHDCASHVEHAEWGAGKCIPEMHTIEENSNGEYIVTHYDVMFVGPDGPFIKENIAVEDLKIVSEMSHGHPRKKKVNEASVTDTHGAPARGAVKKDDESGMWHATNRNGFVKKFADENQARRYAETGGTVSESAEEPEHIAVQLRKVVSIGANHPGVNFNNGSSKVHQNTARLALNRYNAAKPAEKEELQKHMAHSHEALKHIASGGSIKDSPYQPPKKGISLGSIK